MFEEVRDLYNRDLMDHARHPRHAQRLGVFDATADGDNPMCGDRVRVWLKCDDGRVGDVGFEARGCDISIASADMMVDAVRGASPDEVKMLFASLRHMAQTGECAQCAEALAPLKPLSAVHEYPSRVKCVTLPWHALIAALDGNKETTSE
jgi:nitrogen fixation NifU-like protein